MTDERDIQTLKDIQRNLSLARSGVEHLLRIRNHKEDKEINGWLIGALNGLSDVGSKISNFESEL